jgi:glycosyltransferase involved in cell wall biosynthesis
MNNRPHVFLDALLVREKPTGVARSILELTEAMSKQDWGLDFTVLSTTPEMFGVLDGKPHWRVLEVPESRGGNLKKSFYTQFKLSKLLKSEKADLLHSMQFVAPLAMPCPNVVTVHDLSWLLFPDTVEEPRRSYYKYFVPRTLKKSAAIVTNSRATFDDVCREYPHVTNKTMVTPFGTPSWVWQQDEVTEKSPHPYFLFVGTLEPRKNLPVLLEAFEKYLDDYPDPEGALNLVLVGGKGWKASPLQDPINRLQKRGKLEIKDYCDLTELWRHYNMASALLFPSLHEGFGFPILEAMSVGLPVLTANRGAMAEVAGQAAALVDPENPAEIAATMKKLAHDPLWSAAMRKNGPARAKFWSWDETARQTIAVYKDVLSGNS